MSKIQRIKEYLRGKFCQLRGHNLFNFDRDGKKYLFDFYKYYEQGKRYKWCNDCNRWVSINLSKEDKFLHSINNYGKELTDLALLELKVYVRTSLIDQFNKQDQILKVGISSIISEISKNKDRIAKKENITKKTQGKKRNEKTRML